MNRAYRRVRNAAFWSQIRCQPHQLGFDLVPLDRYRGTLDRYGRAVGHDGSAVPVGGCELDIAGSDQVLRDDHRFRVRWNRHVMVDVQGHLGPRALGLDGLDRADFDTGDAHLVAGIDRGGGGEVRGDGLGAKEHIIGRAQPRRRREAPLGLLRLRLTACCAGYAGSSLCPSDPSAQRTTRALWNPVVGEGDQRPR